MKALVTGGGGFLGRYIVEQLLARGDEVSIFSRGAYPDLEEMGVTVFQGNIEEPEAIIKACEGIDVVFHTAAKVGMHGSERDFFLTNVLGTGHVIEACQKNNIQKLVFTSSSSVAYHGEEQIGVDETTPYPTEFLAFYSKTKALSEKMVLEANGKKGLLTISLRPHLIWGPRDKYIIPKIIEAAQKKRIRIIGDGKNLTDITYVENAAAAHLAVADHLKPGSSVCGEAYYITQGEPVLMWGWINMILKEMGIPQITKHVSPKLAYNFGFLCEKLCQTFSFLGEPVMTRLVARQLSTSHTYSIEKARHDFGYKPEISTEEGLENLFTYLKNPSYSE